MVILENKQVNRVKWNEFVLNHEHSNPFQLFEYYDSFKKSNIYTSYVVACADEVTGKIKGILVAVILKEKSLITGIFSRRSIIMGGPLVENDEILESILVTYSALIKNKALYSQFRNFYIFSESQKEIFKKLGYNFIGHLNILKEIPDQEEFIWKQIVRSRKDGINKAKKNSFIFTEENYHEVSNEFYDLLTDLFKKIKLPYPQKEYFDELFVKMGTSKIKMFSLSNDSQRIILLFTLSHQKTLYAYYIGILQDQELQKLRPVDLFYFELLKWCVTNNYKVFDWMGAGKPNEAYGVRKFKLEYGGEPVNFGRFEKIHNSILYQIGKLGLTILKRLKK